MSRVFVLFSVAILSLLGFNKEAFSGEKDAPATEPKTEIIDGYDGIPWGINFEGFKARKNYAGSMGGLTNRFLGGEAKLETLNEYISLLFVGFKSGESDPDFELIPSKFCSIHLGDDVRYIFYDGKFFMAIPAVDMIYFDGVSVGDDNYNVYRKAISRKYNALDTVSKSYPHQILGSHNYTALSFGKGNTRVYLFRGVSSLGQTKETYVGVVYVNYSSCALLKKEIAQRKLDRAKEAMTEKQKEDEAREKANKAIEGKIK